MQSGDNPSATRTSSGRFAAAEPAATKVAGKQGAGASTRAAGGGAARPSQKEASASLAAGKTVHAQAVADAQAPAPAPGTPFGPPASPAPSGGVSAEDVKQLLQSEVAELRHEIIGEIKSLLQQSPPPGFHQPEFQQPPPQQQQYPTQQQQHGPPPPPGFQPAYPRPGAGGGQPLSPARSYDRERHLWDNAGGYPQPGYEHPQPGYEQWPRPVTTYIDPVVPLRKSTLSFQQQLDNGGTGAQRIETIARDPGYVPVNGYEFQKRRLVHQRHGAQSSHECETKEELHQAEPLLDKPRKVNPGKFSENKCYTAREAYELRYLRGIVYSLADIIGYVGGDPAGRIETALPQLKGTFEEAARRLDTLQTTARAEVGYISGADRALILSQADLDDTDRAILASCHPKTAGRLIALNARVQEAKFHATAKAQAAREIAAETKRRGGGTA